MKPVRVYELAVKEVVVQELDPYVEFAYGNFDDLGQVYRTSDPTAPIEFVSNVERIKIQEFCTTSLPEHLGAGCRNLPEVHREYIAIPKDLERLLTIKWQQRVEEEKSRAYKAERRAELEGFECARLQTSIDSWWSMPWYKRAWCAIRASRLQKV